MNPAARFAWFVFALATLVPAFGQGAPRGLPPGVQHFGPLVVIAFNEESPNPDMLRGELLGGNKEERLRALRAMGIESNPELHDLWSEFLHDHASEGYDKGVMQFISGGVLDWNFGEPGSNQAVLDAGFDEQTDHPLEIRGVFELRNRTWRHIATVACRCQMVDQGDPFNPHPGHPNPSQEWVITLPQRLDETTHESHWTELRFRLHEGRLWPLIQFESMFEKCTSGDLSIATCSLVRSALEKTLLVDKKGQVVRGFVVISWRGGLSKELKVQKLYDPHCVGYKWDDDSFSYALTPLKPKTCGSFQPQK